MSRAFMISLNVFLIFLHLPMLTQIQRQAHRQMIAALFEEDHESQHQKGGSQKHAHLFLYHSFSFLSPSHHVLVISILSKCTLKFTSGWKVKKIYHKKSLTPKSAKHYYLLSTISVTGPSLTNDTSIISPKRPVSTWTPFSSRKRLKAL